MQITFFEIEPWEKRYLKKTFPDAHFTNDTLSADAVDKFTETEIASSFIYSDFSKPILDKLPNLKMIATRSTGYNHIDMEECKKREICVVNVPEYGSATVAEHTFALILSLTRKIYQSVNQAKQLNFDHHGIRGIDLYGKTLGIIGLGKIGFHVMKIAKGFGMNIIVYNRTERPEQAQEHGFTFKPLDYVISHADIVTLHVPYTSETHHIINQENIVHFKKGSYLVNTSRGGLIQTQAIFMGLEANILEGVGLDVLEGERDLTEEVEVLTSQFRQNEDLQTLVLDHMLITHPKVLITPHNAFNSKEALLRIIDTTRDNISNYLNGTPKNCIYEGNRP